MADYYAWSDILLGGKSEIARDGRKVIMERNTVSVGDKVTKSDLKKMGLTDAEWDIMLEGGSIRAYPVPEEAGPDTSPSEAIMQRLYSGGEIDQDMLMELSMKHPVAINPPAEEGATVEAPEGA